MASRPPAPTRKPRGQVYYYQNHASAKVDYNRYLHELRPRSAEQHGRRQTVTARPSSTAADPKIIKQDLSAGQDYAVRVQELKTSVKWYSDENFRARVDMWGLQKDGTRQVNAVAMCYNDPPNNSTWTLTFRPTI